MRQHVHLGLELGVRRDRARLAQHLAALHVVTLGAAQQQAGVVARLALVQQLAEHLHARDRSVFWVGRMPTISISSPTLMMPRSMRPVTTVPRPEIENTSSTGIRNGLSIVALRLRDPGVQRLDQLQDRRHADVASGRLPAP